MTGLRRRLTAFLLALYLVVLCAAVAGGLHSCGLVTNP